ncbi:MAG TPA: nuclear transport factor 2 family protein [Gemmatimonadaceae bacterium]|nr:nuclear transport factor 2 family protein [Gemmatimonadaceae bacterium]
MPARALLVFLALFGAVIMPDRVLGQSSADSAGVRRAALDYLEGFYEGDSTKHVQSVRSEVYKYGFWLPRDSTRFQGEQMPWAEFLAYTRRMKARGATTPASAPREVQLLDVQDQTAAAKVTAFWGTDYLLIGKYDGRWMVSSVLWQSRPRPRG